MILLAGCSAEKKLAKVFIEDGIKDDFLLLTPDFIYKYNLKTYEFPGIDTLEEYKKDSILVVNSLFLNKIDDAVLISEFADNFIKTFTSYGIRIYPEDFLDTFLAERRKAYVINVAQISLEEYVYPYSTDEVINDEVIEIKDIDLNALNYNSWLEVTLLNGEGNQKVLFGSDFLLDRLNGTLKQYLFSGEMRFDYTIDTITTRDIYRFAGDFGKKMAGYFFDYYMNKYIDENLPASYPYLRYYYHYDPVKHDLYPVEPKESLIELTK